MLTVALCATPKTLPGNSKAIKLSSKLQNQSPPYFPPLPSSGFDLDGAGVGNTVGHLRRQCLYMGAPPSFPPDSASRAESLGPAAGEAASRTAAAEDATALGCSARQPLVHFSESAVTVQAVCLTSPSQCLCSCLLSANSACTIVPTGQRQTFLSRCFVLPCIRCILTRCGSAKLYFQASVGKSAVFLKLA
jgi:hypothetical protein